MNTSSLKRKIFPAGAVILSLLFIISSAQAQISLPEDPARGARLFVSKGCVKCHAFRGAGGTVGPDFARIDLGNTLLELASKLLNHIPSMMQGMERMKMLRPTLSGDEITDICAYLYFLRFFFDEPGNSSRGKYLFDEKGCGRCHPLSGRGREGEPGLDQFPQNISPVYLSEMIWNHGSVMIAEMVRLGMKWPTLEGTEMMDLLEYIRMNAKGPKEAALVAPGNPREGRKIFVQKGCIKCHAIQGEGGKVGMDLGKRAKLYYKSLTQIASIMWDKGPTVLAKMAQPQTGVPKFTAKEMADLLAYLYFLHFMDEPGNPLNGKKVYVDMGCSKCHGLEGKPGELMRIDLSKYQKASNPLDIVAGIWNHSPQIEKAFRENGITWPRFKREGMADLLEYVRSVKNK